MGWDSEEEGKRSVRGVELRRKRREEDMAARAAQRAQRAQRDTELAGRTFDALMLEANRGGLGTLARDRDNLFFETFSIFYRNLLASNLGRAIRRRIPPDQAADPGIIAMLGNIKRTHITFQQIQQQRGARNALVSIGYNEDFSEGYLEDETGTACGTTGTTPVGSRQSSSSSGRGK